MRRIKETFKYHHDSSLKLGQQIPVKKQEKNLERFNNKTERNLAQIYEYIQNKKKPEFQYNDSLSLGGREERTEGNRGVVKVQTVEREDGIHVKKNQLANPLPKNKKPQGFVKYKPAPAEDRQYALSTLQSKLHPSSYPPPQPNFHSFRLNYLHKTKDQVIKRNQNKPSSQKISILNNFQPNLKKYIVIDFAEEDVLYVQGEMMEVEISVYGNQNSQEEPEIIFRNCKEEMWEKMKDRFVQCLVKKKVKIQNKKLEVMNLFEEKVHKVVPISIDIDTRPSSAKKSQKQQEQQKRQQRGNLLNNIPISPKNSPKDSLFEPSSLFTQNMAVSALNTTVSQLPTNTVVGMEVAPIVTTIQNPLIPVSLPVENNSNIPQTIQPNNPFTSFATNNNLSTTQPQSSYQPVANNPFTGKIQTSNTHTIMDSLFGAGSMGKNNGGNNVVSNGGFVLNGSTNGNSLFNNTSLSASMTSTNTNVSNPFTQAQTNNNFFNNPITSTTVNNNNNNNPFSNFNNNNNTSQYTSQNNNPTSNNPFQNSLNNNSSNSFTKSVNSQIPNYNSNNNDFTNNSTNYNNNNNSNYNNNNSSYNNNNNIYASNNPFSMGGNSNSNPYSNPYSNNSYNNNQITGNNASNMNKPDLSNQQMNLFSVTQPQNNNQFGPKRKKEQPKRAFA